MQKGSFRTVVPLHPDLSPGTLLAILKQSGLSRDDIERLL
jgi:predicted RNA binding protein YcfA (HicA-like mRNA interferase family)